MRVVKRSIALLLCLLMCLSLFPASALAEELTDAEPAEQMEEPAAVVEAEEPAEEPAEEAAAWPEESEPAEEPAAPEETEPAAEEAESPAEAAPVEAPAELPEEESPAAEEFPAEEALVPEAEDAFEEEDPFVEEDAELDEDIEIVVEQEPVGYAPGGPVDNDSLLTAYAQRQLDSLRHGASAQGVHDSGITLFGVNRTVFYNLKSQIASVADGSVTSTVLSIPVEDLGLSKTSWTAEDLGLETLIVVNEDGSSTFSDEAMAAVNAQVNFSLRNVVTALLSDCPCELYWYDKTVGTSLKSYNFSGSRIMIKISGSMTFTFAVASAYSDGTYKDVSDADGSVTRYYCGVDSYAAQGIHAAVNNAAEIAEYYAASSDYDKLKAFKDEICSLVSYNSEAAGGGSDYGDPWQLVWVFDRDARTNVVCEGYAKAFQYLCDISNLSASVMAYSVTGTMNGGTGAGAHMWNIVHMENGKNYLVDVTNCDAGSVGAPDGLFLAGYTNGSVSEGYSFTANSRTISYSYEEKIRSVFSDSELTISSKSYIDDINTPDPGTVRNLEHLKAEIEDFLGSGETSRTIRFSGDGAFVVYEDVTIPMGMNFFLSKGTLFVEDGVEMSIARGGTVTAKNAQIDGTLSVLGTLSMSAADSELEVGGTLDNMGSVVVLDTGFARTANMKASGGRYYVEHFAGDEAALRSACEIAAADSDSAVTHEIYPQAMIALSADLTVPANVRMRINSATGVSTAAGVALTNSGEIVSKQSLQLLGRTVNDGTLTLMRGINAAFGTYEGTGVLKVYKDGADPFTHLSGLNEDAFDFELGQDNYWTLRVKSFTVTWLNDDGSVLWESVVSYGAVPTYGGSEPTKAATAQYTYSFAGWSPEIAAVTGDTVYTAVFSSTVNEYTIRFVSDDGTELQTSVLPYGETPVYSGQTPTKAATAQYTYSFAGWSPELTAVTGNATYVAVFAGTVNEYTVRFVNDDGTELQAGLVPYGETPVYSGETPTKAPTAQHTYIFTGWSPEIAAVTGDVTYTAVYRERSAGWREIDGKIYYYGEDGKPVTYWQQIDGNWYHFSASGVMDTGWLKSADKWYYLGADGAMVTGFVTVSGQTYYMDENGAMLTGWQNLDGNWYYFKSSGAMAVGWLQISGKWYYFDAEGVMQRYWQQIGGSWYHFSGSGAMDTGWLKSDGNWYYLKSSGAMATGWQQVGSTWYYFNAEGKMQTGWQKIGSTWYYFKDSGAMVTGWQKIGSTWYYFQSSGAMKTGWLKLDGSWYYFEASGAMVTGSKTINGKTYNFNSSGVCLNP